MLEVINAIYEKGMLKPLDVIHLKEHQKVKIIIQSNIKWAQEFKQLIHSVHSRNKKFSSKEIEDDITAAYRSVRNKSART